MKISGKNSTVYYLNESRNKNEDGPEGNRPRFYCLKQVD